MKNIRGAITVEASFVMPLFVFLIVGIMMVSMYVHDVIVTKAIVTGYLDKSVLVVNKGYDIKKSCLDYEKIADRKFIEKQYDKVFCTDKADISKVNKYVQNDCDNNLLICKLSKIKFVSEKGKVKCTVVLENTLKNYPLINKIAKKTVITESSSLIDESELVRFADVYLSKK